MLSTGWPKLGFSVSAFFLSKHRKNRQRLQFLPPLQNAAPGSKAHRPRGGSTKTAGSSTALATSTGQRTRLDRAHGGTHPAKGWPPERARRGHRSPGKGLPWVGAALRAAALEGESASWVQGFARPRLTASRSKALMRVCQPGPVALNASNTSASTRIFRIGRLERFHAWALSRVTATRRPAAPSTASNVLTVGLPFGPSAR